MSPVSLVCAALGLLMPTGICQADPQLVILVADFGTSDHPGMIYKVNIHHMNIAALSIPNVVAPVGINYDKLDNHIYWTDTYTKQVRRADIDGGNDRIIASLNSTSIPAGLTLDSNTRQVFYTDQGNNVTSIVRIEMANFQSTVIVNTALDKPRGIVADTRNRKLYWVDWASDKMETSTYTGSQRRTVVSSGLVAPHGVTIDEQAGRLFLTDGRGFIESVLVDGTDRKRLRTESGTNYLDIAIFDDFLYYTQLSDRGIYTLTVDGKYWSSLTSRRLQDPTGVYIYSPNVDTIASCPYGQHGTNCVTCGKCEHGSPCEKTTGICFKGCSPGYKEEICTQVCDSGTFGEGCESVCTNHCKTGTVCDHVTGSCPEGCEAGWSGDNCTMTCPSNTYGACIPCGQCAGGASCDTVTGYCADGCQPGWTGSRCDSETANDDTNNDLHGDSGPSTGLIAGIAAGVSVVIIAVIVVVAVYCKRKQRRNQDNAYVDFDPRSKGEDGYTTLGNLNTSGVFSVQNQRQNSTLGDTFG